MLTNDRRYWVIGATRFDIFAMRFIKRNLFDEYDWRSHRDMFVFSAIVCVVIVFFAFFIDFSVVNANAWVGIGFVLTLLVTLTISSLFGFLMTRRFSNIAYRDFFDAERFEMQLLLNGWYGERKALRGQRAAIDEYLRGSQYSDTAEWGLDVKRRPLELAYRKRKVDEAKKILVEMYDDPVYAARRCTRVVRELDALERQRLDEYMHATIRQRRNAFEQLDDVRRRIKDYNELKVMLENGK